MNIYHLSLLSIVIAMIAILSISNNQTLYNFEKWKDQYGIAFDSPEEEFYRIKIFEQNADKISEHNSQPNQSYRLGVNQFAAMSQNQFQAAYLTLLSGKQDSYEPQIIESQYKILGDIDWTAQGAVTPAKDEGGKCGACWAFSAVGALQGLSKISSGTLETFSEQQLIDCSQKYGNYGCNGGWMTSSFNFVKDNGIATEKEYPYAGVQQKCQKQTGSFKISGYIEAKTCQDLSNILQKGPVSAAVDASNWYLYQSGVFSNCKTNLNFALVLVGQTDAYWRLKNSWGTSWGENGYIRLAKGNTCGICLMASIPRK